MTLFGFLHIVTSLAVVLPCWWLAHEEARRKPPGRLAAIGYSLGGMGILAVMLGRATETSTPIMDVMQIATKAGFAITFATVSYRAFKRRMLMRHRRKRRARNASGRVPRL